jgi:hypothetical protein
VRPARPLHRCPSALTSARCGSCPPPPTQCRHGSLWFLLVVGGTPFVRLLGSPATDRPPAAAAFLLVPTPALPGPSGSSAFAISTTEPSPALPRPRRPVHPSLWSTTTSIGLPPAAVALLPSTAVPHRCHVPTPSRRVRCGRRAGKEVPSLPSAPPFLSATGVAVVCGGSIAARWSSCYCPGVLRVLRWRGLRDGLFLVAIISGTRCDSHCLVYHFGSGGWQCCVGLRVLGRKPCLALASARIGCASSRNYPVGALCLAPLPLVCQVKTWPTHSWAGGRQRRRCCFLPEGVVLQDCCICFHCLRAVSLALICVFPGCTSCPLAFVLSCVLPSVVLVW